MDEETQNFVEAVQNDEYAEYELEDGFILITDWEGDGLFDPYVVLPDGFDDVGRVENLLYDEAGDFMTADGVEIEEQNYLTIGYIYGAELTVDTSPSTA